METQRGFTRRFHSGPIADNPILEAIFENNVDQFKALVSNDPTAVNNGMLLSQIIKLHRREMFDHLLSFATFDPDCPDNVNRNMLMWLANVPGGEPFALALIDRGANVRWLDGSGFTYLHMAARAVDVDNTTVAQAAIERGADVDATTNRGETPLYLAAQAGNYPFCCLLLYYGADATISTDEGVLPVAATARWVSPARQPRLQELLFDYTFDDGEAVVSLATLVEAMIADTPLFGNIVENVAEVVYDSYDLDHFCASLKYLRPQNLRLFLTRFGNIVRELMYGHRLLITLVELGWICDKPEFKAVWDVFYESEYFPEMVQASNTKYPTIANLMEDPNQRRMFWEREELTEIACVMLTSGLEVTSVDLDVVFKYYGYCDLFRILLHMDVKLLEKVGATVASFYYNLRRSIDDVISDVVAVQLLNFFNHPKLKELCLKSDKEEIVAKAKSMPQVPSLVELSRNMARQHIINRYKIKNSSQFYTILKWLPIGEIWKIIALERKLYFSI